MMLLHGMNSIVLLFALVKIDTSHSQDSDVHANSPSSDSATRAGTGLYLGDTCFTPRSDTWIYHPAAEAGQIPVLLSLVKGALRSVTGHLDGAAHAGYQVSTLAMFIGIRG